jgi:hypothetical protein
MKPLPKEKTICGIMHRIQEHEGIVTFTEVGGCWGCGQTISFHRAENGKGCWYVELGATGDGIMLSHIIEAGKIVHEYRGDNWAAPITAKEQLHE